MAGLAFSPFGGLAASVVVLQASRFVTDLVLAGVVAPRDYGIWKLVQVFLIFAPLLLVGIPSGINRELPRRVGEERELSSVIGTGSGASIVGLFVIGYLAGTLAPGEAPKSLVALALVGWGSFGVLCGMLNGLERFGTLAVAQLGTAGLLVVLIPLTVVFGLGGFFAQYALAGTAGAAFAFVTVVRQCGFRLQLSRLRDLVWAGFPLAVIGLAYVGSISVDRLLVARFLGLEQLGVYGVAATVFAAGLTLPTTAVQYWYPRTIREYARTRDSASVAATCRRQARLVGMLGIAAGATAAVALTPIVPVLLSEYVDALPALYLLIPGLLFASAAGPWGNLLIALGRPRPYLAAQIGALALEAGLVGAAAAYGSIVWVAGAMTLSFAAYFAAVRVVAVRVAAVPPRIVTN